MSETIRISDSEFYSEVKSTAAIQTRSIGDQALHWMKIGKAIEESSSFDYNHVKAALKGELPVEKLTVEERIFFENKFFENFNDNIEKDFANHFESLKEVDIFYGMDEDDNIITE